MLRPPADLKRPRRPQPARRERARPASLLLIAATLTAAAACIAGAASAAPLDRKGNILIAGISGPITPITVEYVDGALDRSRDEDGWGVVIFEIDTPGGLVESMERIIQAILKSRIPVVVYVTPAGAQAASAGLYITNAADVAAMAPGTTIGAGHPVMAGGGNPGGETKEGERNYINEKVENSAAAGVRGIATKRGRNAEVYEKMVRDSISLTAEEAIEKDVVDILAPNLDDLLGALEGRTIERFDGTKETLLLAGGQRERLAMTPRQKVLSWLTHPQIAFLMLGIGMLGIYIEFSHPGLIVPGVAGGLALILFAMSVHVLPVNVLGIVLIGLAAVLFILEINITSYGLLTIGGILALTLGFVTLFDVEKMPGLRVPLTFILPTSLTIGIIMGAITWLAVRAHNERVVTGREGLAGEIGEAVTEVGVGGKVFVHGEYWNARTAGNAIPRGTRVRIAAVRDMTLEVVPADRSGEGA